MQAVISGQDPAGIDNSLGYQDPKTLFTRINWQHHDGVSWPMINDHVRNQFYDCVMAEHVRDRNCIDIGFGTGLLTMLALKHGARHVVAYENNADRYQLGEYIIHSLKLQDKIELRNTTYQHQASEPGRVLFSETVNGNLWGESLWHSLPREPGAEFLPGQYWMEIHALPVCDSFAYQCVTGNQQHTSFYPGVDIDHDFQRLIADLAFDHSPNFDSLTPGIHRLGTGVETAWGYIPWQRLTHESAPVVASYRLDAGAGTLTTQDADGTRVRPIDWNADSLYLELDTEQFRQQTVLLVPRMGMAQGNHRLTLDLGHWGPAVCAVMAVRPHTTIGITHRTADGGLLYNYN
jgi:hypothetical protein